MTVLEQSLADQRQRLTEAEANVAALQQTLEKTTHQLETASYWVRGFGQRGLKAYILGDVLDRLQRIANEVLQQLAGDHMRVRWVADKQVDGVLVPDRLDLLVQRGNQDECDYSYCSLGEQARVWIAMEWAVGEIALGKVDVRFIDECFDGLSKQGVERAVRLVAGEATERRLICISHREQVERFFNRRVTVAMRNGISSLEGYQYERGTDGDHEDGQGAVGAQSAA
jgi:DNA repair exonuclease SbcCD ATPase subunit